MDNKGCLYDLAMRVKEIAISDTMKKKRDLWRDQNSFLGDRPLIYIRAFAVDEWFDKSILKCEDPMLRSYEYELHQSVWRADLGDDYIVEPWLDMDASYVLHNGYRWGVPVTMGEKPVIGGAAAFKPILTSEDFSCLKTVPYKVNEKDTALRLEKLQCALDGALAVHVSRQGPYSMWSGDISTDIAKMRGLEQLMWDVYDSPEWLHSLLTFMRDTILDNHRQAEINGGYDLADHENQCMPYCLELEDPDPSVTGVSRKRLIKDIAHALTWQIPCRPSPARSYGRPRSPVRT